MQSVKDLEGKVIAMPRFAPRAATTARAPVPCSLPSDSGSVGAVGAAPVAMDPHSGFWPAAGSRASSINSTGMSSRTG